MHPFNKLMEKKLKEKGKSSMSPVEKQAKMNVVHDMRKMASDEMAEPLKGLKKVSVASDSPEGLKMGLDKAKDIVDQHADGDGGDSDGSELDKMSDGGAVDLHGEHHMLQDDGLKGSLHDSDEEGLEEETGDDLNHDDEEGESPEHIAKVDESHAEQHRSDLSNLTPEEIDKKIHELSMMKALHQAKHGR